MHIPAQIVVAEEDEEIYIVYTMLSTYWSINGVYSENKQRFFKVNPLFTTLYEGSKFARN